MSEYSSSNWIQWVKDLLFFGLWLVIIFFIIFPYFWTFSTSIKPAKITFANPPVWFDFIPTIKHYKIALFDAGLATTLWNSLYVAVGNTILSLLVGVPAAYALARFSFWRKKDIWFWIISNRFITPIVMALPFYLIARTLGIKRGGLFNMGFFNELGMLMVIYMTFNVPIVVWLNVDQFRAIPPSLEETALVEGANPFQAFYKVAVPLAAPGIAVSALFTFIFAWNELLYALVLTSSDTNTAPVTATNFMTALGVKWGPMMATGTMIVIPVLILSTFLYRHLTSGLTMGAVK